MGRYVEAACTRFRECGGTESIERCWMRIVGKFCTIDDCTRIVDYDLEGQQWSQCLREVSESPCDELDTPAVCKLP